MESFDLSKMFDYLENKDTKEEYNNYLKYIQYYYEKPSLKFKSKYLKSIITDEDGTEYYLLTDVLNKKKIKIKPPIYINLYDYIQDANNKLDTILYNISTLVEDITTITNENRAIFNEQKVLYKQYKEHILQYNEINNVIKTNIDTLLDSKLSKIIELSKYYNTRQEIYATIKTMITVKQRNELIDLYKKSKKNISSDKILEYSKKYELPVVEIEKWIQWIENVYLFILKQNEIIEINNNINTYINNNDYKFQYLIISPPKVIILN